MYVKEIKYQICKRIVEKEISVEKASLECGASIGTIKKWVNLYEKDPDNAFKKKDIEGGVRIFLETVSESRDINGSPPLGILIILTS